MVLLFSISKKDIILDINERVNKVELIDKISPSDSSKLINTEFS